MKKIIALLALLSVGIGITQANEFTPKSGEHYQTIKHPKAINKEVIEFFSFYCQHCASFQLELKIPQRIHQAMPTDTKVTKYHVDFLGAQSAELSRAWALANVTNTTHLIEDPLFIAVQAGKVKSMQDIRQIFIDNGVDADTFDNGINSFAVNSWVNKQSQIFEQYQSNIPGVPAFIVNGNQLLDPTGFRNVTSMEQFAEQYSQSVLTLLAQ